MSAKKEESAPSKSAQLARVAAWLFLGPPRGLSWSVVAIIAFAAGSYALWRHVRPQLLEADDYVVTAADVEITPPPSWIRRDLAGDVVRGLSLDAPLSILDEDLAQRIHDAFAAQPWVARVERVVKQHPARVRVDLAYRRPVCMVEAPGALLPGSGTPLSSRLVPIDADGVLLPEADFTPAQREQYPRLIGVPAAPPGVPGNRWSDARVIGGALIAAALVDTWKDYSLSRMVVSQKADTSLGNEEYTYELFTERGTRILWGHAPNTRMPGEVPLADKLARLKQIYKQSGSLEDAGNPQIIDLRHWHHARVFPSSPRTATRDSDDAQRK